MDTAETKMVRLEKSIAREGETVVFERINVDVDTGIATIELSIEVPAWIRSHSPQDLIDTEARDIRVVVSPRLLLTTNIGSPPQVFGIPKRDDRIIIQNSPANIQEISPVYWGGIPVRINFLCRG